MRIHTRIAPTPSGFLHTGNLYSFVLTWLLCKSKNGTLLLRIDDMDGPRVRDAYLEDIFETLSFIDLHYDTGPVDMADFRAHFQQAKRVVTYNNLLQELVKTGNIYACTCSRKELAALATKGINHCDCQQQSKSLDTPGASWRIMLPEECRVEWNDEKLGKISIDLAASMGDFVIRRRDGLPAYQVCSLADDLLFEINYIVRGEDLLTSTAAQLYLASILNKDQFLETRFYHHPLLKNADGEKLSKSAGDTSIKAFRENGGTAVTLLQQIAGLPGIEVYTPVNGLDELLKLFKPA